MLDVCLFHFSVAYVYSWVPSVGDSSAKTRFSRSGYVCATLFFNVVKIREVQMSDVGSWTVDSWVLTPSGFRWNEGMHPGWRTNRFQVCACSAWINGRL